MGSVCELPYFIGTGLRHFQNEPDTSDKSGSVIRCVGIMADHHNEELLGLLDRIKEFLRTHVDALEADFLRRPFRDLIPALNTTREKVKALGLWAPHLPKEHGGLGLTLSEFALVSEELGRTPIGHYVDRKSTRLNSSHEW